MESETEMIIDRLPSQKEELGKKIQEILYGNNIVMGLDLNTRWKLQRQI